MLRSIPMHFRLMRMLAVCTAAMMAAGGALAVVAQEPLLSANAGVKPNIALVLDTSNSMGRDCVYASPLARAMDRENVNNFSCLYPGQNHTSPRPFEAEFLQSPFNNSLYYDPKKTYGTGYRKGLPVDLKDVPIDNSSVVTLYLPKDEATRKFLESTNATIRQFQTQANYTRYEITTTAFAQNPFGPHNGQRSDCAGGTCTHAEERRNIANWRAAHRFRIYAAKNGLSAAFARQAENFRLTYKTLYQFFRDAPPMKDFGLAKSDFFPWLDALGVADNTPLRGTLADAGAYFENKSNRGPWASKPWLLSAEDPKQHLSCRRANTILITDGYWTDTDPVAGDADSASGPRHTHARDASIAYQYKPGDKHPLSLGKSDNTDGTSRGPCLIGVNCAKDTLADIAFKYWATDLRPDLDNDASKGGRNDPPFWQNMTTHTVSFGAQGSLTDEMAEKAKQGALNWPAPTPDQRSTIDDLRHAAHNGGGKFLMIMDAAQFSKDLGDVIGQIASQRLSESGVAATGTVLNAETRKFVPSYNSGTWWGNLRKVRLGGAEAGKDVVEWQVVDTDAGGQPTGKTTLPSPAARRIFVWVGAAKQAVAFTPANIDLPDNQLKGGNAKLQMSSAVTSNIVNFLRGDRTQEGSAFRSRAAVLGDIVNSTPVFIKNNTNPKYEKLPKGTPGLDYYADYLNDKGKRTEGVLFAGANDGMLHAFAEGDGRELFAYVPRSVLGKMESLASSAYTHTYLVDGPLTEADAYVTTPNPADSGTATGWRNLVLGTAGAGAKAVFALNVTDPFSMNGKSVLWEINADPDFPVLPGNGTGSFQELGHVLNAAQSGITNSGSWVSVFGNGYDSKSGQASLFIVETGSGKLLKEIKTDSAKDNGLGGVRLVLNSERKIIGAYAGDLKGRLWKFDLSGPVPDAWGLGNGGNALFSAQTKEGLPLPITAQPAVMERSDQPGFRPSYMVTIATGKLFEAGDPGSTGSVQAVYGLWDILPFGTPGGKTITEDQLESMTARAATAGIDASAGTVYTVGPTDPSVTGINWTLRRGWKLNLGTFPGERVIYPLQTLNQVVKVDTIVPQPNTQSCTATTSSGRSFYINPLTGTCRRNGTLDTNADGKIDAGDANVCAYKTLADGSDATLVILSSPDSGTGPNADIGYRRILSSENDRLVSTDDPPPHASLASPSTKGITSRSWRQIFPRAN